MYEFGCDYLRDNMKYSRESMVQRPFNFAIVDEVDSILVDEARTPLIISGPTEDKTDLYVAVDAVVKVLTKESRSEEHTSELQSLMRLSYDVFCLKKKKKKD